MSSKELNEIGEQLRADMALHGEDVAYCYRNAVEKIIEGLEHEDVLLATQLRTAHIAYWASTRTEN